MTTKNNKNSKSKTAKGRPVARAKPRKNKKRKANRVMKEDCVRSLARSVLNPWGFTSCIPDGAHGIGAFSIKQASSIATSAAGSTMLYALSCYGTGVYDVSTVGAGATISAPGGTAWAVASNNTAITALYNRIRLVSAGIKVGYSGTTTSDSGTLLLGQVAAGIPLSNFDAATLAGAARQCQYYKLFPLRHGGKITWRPCDYDDQGAFQENWQTTTTLSSNGLFRPYMVALVFGAAINGAGNILVESVTNWEGQFKDPSFSPAGDGTNSAARAEPGWFEKFQNVVSGVAPIVSMLADTFVGEKPAATRLVTRGGPLIEEI